MNVTARLEQAARPEEILVGEASARRLAVGCMLLSWAVLMTVHPV